MAEEAIQTPTKPPRPPPPKTQAPLLPSSKPLEVDAAISPQLRRQASMPRSKREAIEPPPVRKRPRSMVDMGTDELPTTIGLGTSRQEDTGDETCPITVEVAEVRMESRPVSSREPLAGTENKTEDEICLLTSSNNAAPLLLNETVRPSQELSHDQPCEPPLDHASSDKVPSPSSSLSVEAHSASSQEIRRPPRPPNRPPPPHPRCEPVPPSVSIEEAATDPGLAVPVVLPPLTNDQSSSNETCHLDRPSRPPRPSSAPIKYKHRTKLEEDVAVPGNNDVTPSVKVCRQTESTTDANSPSEADDSTPSASSSPSQRRHFLRNVRMTFKSLRLKMTKRRGSAPDELEKDQSCQELGRTRSVPHRSKSGGCDNEGTRVRYPDPLPSGVIDPLVIQCVSYLNRKHILEEEGLFRIPGDVATIRRLRGMFVMGNAVDLNTILDPHTVAGLMKAHFREQKTSIIPRGEPLAAIVKAVEQKNVVTMSQILYGIGITQTATLRMVAELMKAVVENSLKNKMTTSNLGTSMGPSLFPYLPPSTASHVLCFMVDHVTEIFNT